jgi:dihydropteroate synthase
MIWKIRNRSLSCDRTLVMGILNVTPDSFSDGGHYSDPQTAAEKALELVKQGADLLDIGAESTRPGAPAITAEEELRRLLPALELIRSKVPVPLSIDTTKAEVAKACLEKGVSIINDVSALAVSGKEMADLAREYGAGLILMHRRGNPETMQTLAVYKDVVEEVLLELEESVERARSWGVGFEQIVIDPGFGFSKTAEQNLEMLASFEKFQRVGRPVLAGPSRKSFLGVLTGKEPESRDWATTAAVSAAVLKGAQMIRVHEPGAMKDVAQVAEKIRALTPVRQHN